ncbi:MAG TPA: adenylate/guanylate cyclase domain-containing protein, partial [Acidimicrobiales bacterium]
FGMRPDIDRVNQLRSARAPGAPRAAACKGPGRSDVGPASVRSVILFTDVVDSTRLTEELGDARYRERARRLEEVVTSTIAAHGGNIVSGINLGDGFIGLFDSAEQAIDAARRCAQDCCSSELHLHLALHTGAILVDGPRIYGSAVNLAARICTLTGPDEILVSEALHGLAGTFAQIAFVDRGVHSLKGIAEPQRLYGLVEPADPH